MSGIAATTNTVTLAGGTTINATSTIATSTSDYPLIDRCSLDLQGTLINVGLVLSTAAAALSFISAIYISGLAFTVAGAYFLYTSCVVQYDTQKEKQQLDAVVAQLTNENTAAQTRITELGSQMRTRTGAAQARITQLTDENEQLNTQQAADRQVIDLLRLQAQQFTNQRLADQQAMDQLRASLEATKQDLEKSEGKISEFRCDVQTAIRVVKHRDLQIFELEKERDIERKNLKDLDSRIAELTRENNDLNANTGNLQTANNDLTAKIERYTSSFDLLSAKTSNVADAILRLAADAGIKVDISEIINRNKALVQTINGNDLNLDSNFATYLNILNQQDVNAAVVYELLAQKKALAEPSTTASTTSMTEIRQEIVAKSLELADIQKQIVELNQAKRKIESETTAKSQTLENLQSNILMKTEALKDLRTQTNEADTEFEEIHKKISELTKEEFNLRISIDILHSDRHELLRQNAQLVQTLNRP